MLLRRRLTLALSLLVFSLGLSAPFAAAAEYWVYFGSQGTKPGVGISVARFDAERGEFSPARKLVETPAPSFIAVHPDGQTLYSCNAVREFLGAPGGGVSAFRIDAKTGDLTALNSANTGAPGACFVGFDNTGTFLLTANYSGASAAIFRLETDGHLGARTAFVQHEGRGAHPDRQKEPHPHSAWTDPSNKFVLVPDLGTDRVVVYRFDAIEGTLVPHTPPAAKFAGASGPRHLAWSRDGKTAFVLNEINATVSRCAWDAANGTLTELQVISTLPAYYTGPNTTAEIKVSPSGRFVYATNRTHDSIAVYAIDSATGALSLVEHVSSGGKWPRNLLFLDGGKWLLASNHNSDNAQLFTVDRATGKLTPHGAPIAVTYPFGLAARAVE